MDKNNKHNILYFEGQSMKQLHNNMDEWQKDNEKRFLSMSVNKDGDNYCCIALTNPSEVTITNDKLNVNIAGVTTTDELYVGTSGSYSVIPVEVKNTVDVKGSVSVDYLCKIFKKSPAFVGLFI